MGGGEKGINQGEERRRVGKERVWKGGRKRVVGRRGREEMGG